MKFSYLSSFILVMSLPVFCFIVGAVFVVNFAPHIEPDPRDLPPIIDGGTSVSRDLRIAPPISPNQSSISSLPVNGFLPREIVDSAGYNWIMQSVEPWPRNSSLNEIAARFKSGFAKSLESLSRRIDMPNVPADENAMLRFTRASFLNGKGEPVQAYEDLCVTRAWLESVPEAAREFLFTVVYYQGVTALRRGENENCIMCRGESSCILPIAPSAMHKNKKGSELAIHHFTEYLDQFPDDTEVRWLLNVAYMTLGKHPHDVPNKYLISLDRWNQSEKTIGKFRDVGAAVGVNRLNQAGGAIMEDFDNDKLLDVVVSTFDPTTAMAVYKNNGNGKFDDVSANAGVLGQLGGLNCMQTDFNNDGLMDVFIVRGAWLTADRAIRPTLLQNMGDLRFEDVTEKAGLATPVNAIAASWADYDNDGWLDLFIPCERQACRLYHNNKDGTCTERAFDAGLAGQKDFGAKGSTWLDLDNDGYQDLFVNHLSLAGARLYRNQKDGTFADVSDKMGIADPILGFSCWAFDYNNDGWQDIFATCYERSVEATVLGMVGHPTPLRKSVLYRNMKGQGFQNVSQESGLDAVYFTMGSNFGDFNNDGYLDFYLGTGEPSLGSLVPNRMLLNNVGKQFVDVTSASGTGNLQKGHGVACGDWNCDGQVDIFIEMGGAVNGDKYHNILFQNPGTSHKWVTIKLMGTKSNRAAIGAHIALTTRGSHARTIHRWINSGSSFGANALEQTFGLGLADEIDSVEVTWPTSGQTQLFKDVPTNAFVEIAEQSDSIQITERTSFHPPME